MGVGGEWEAEGGLNHPLAQGKSHCVSNKAQKQPQCTCRDKMVVESNLIPHAALYSYVCAGKHASLAIGISVWKTCITEKHITL